LDSRKAVSFSRLLKVLVLGIVENMSGMVCPKCGENIYLFKRGGGEKAARDLGVPFLGRIPIDPQMVIMGDAGTPLVMEPQPSVVKSAFKSLTQDVIKTTARLKDQTVAAAQ